MDNLEEMTNVAIGGGSVNSVVGVKSCEEEYIIENLTYDDYLSSVYTYEDACEAYTRAQSEAAGSEREYKNAARELDEQLGLDADNRVRYDEIVDAEIEKKKEIWTKNQARFDVKLSTKKALAENMARNEIQNKKDEYTAEVENCKREISAFESKLDSLDKEYSELKERRKKFDNFTGANFPPVDDKASDILRRAREKRLLTKGQEEMIEGDVAQPCQMWLTGFDSLIDMETEFARSEFFKKLEEGRVTRTVITKFANITAIITAGVLTLISVVMALFEPNVVSLTIHTLLSLLAVGGVFACVTHVLRERFENIKNLPIPERAMLIIMFILGAAAGLFSGLYLIAPSRSVASLVFAVIFSLCTGLLTRRLLMMKFACRRLSAVTHLRDKARRELFEKYEHEEGGRYTFMIYCYLCHESVLTYLSMEYSQKEIESIQQKLGYNRNDHKHYSESLARAKAKRAALRGEEQTVKDFERSRFDALAKELIAIEAERPSEPDFRAEVLKTCASKLAPLDKEHKEFSEKIERLKREVRVLDEDSQHDEQIAENCRAQKKLIAGALRQWKKTPMPIATDYRLVDKLCIDSKSQLTIVTHSCKPIVLRYRPKQRPSEPGSAAAGFIYKYVRGLCKINPRRLMQINIFDFISDPRTYIGYRSFDRLSDKGVISGVYSQRDFEIRLFSNMSGYSTFKDFFKIECSKVSAFINENRDSLPETSKPGLAEVNKAAAEDGLMFMYQVCVFVVPREEDRDRFHPPKSLLDLIDKGIYSRLGILPVFIADSESVADEWKPVVDKYAECDHIFSVN